MALLIGRVKPTVAAKVPKPEEQQIKDFKKKGGNLASDAVLRLIQTLITKPLGATGAVMAKAFAPADVSECAVRNRFNHRLEWLLLRRATRLGSRPGEKRYQA